MNTISCKNSAGTAALALTCALFAAATVRGAEIKVVTSGAFTAAYLELVPEYERATHSKLVTEFGPSMGTTHNAIPIRLERGEAIDVVIMAAPALADLIKQGKVRAGSRVDLVRSNIGMAVKAGAPKPDISTVDALKRTYSQRNRLRIPIAPAVSTSPRSCFRSSGLSTRSRTGPGRSRPTP
jgi:ABC-type molybdate transport system substrate-binding protein